MAVLQPSRVPTTTADLGTVRGVTISSHTRLNPVNHQEIAMIKTNQTHSMNRRFAVLEADYRSSHTAQAAPDYHLHPHAPPFALVKASSQPKPRMF